MMNLVSYIQMNRIVSPSGVGNHILNVTSGLEANPEVKLHLLISKSHIQLYNASNFASIPVQTFPLTFSNMQYVWWLTDRPKAEYWYPELDWVYCPAESYIPTRRGLAVTIHDLHAFETDLPWAQTYAHKRFRMRWKLLFGKILERADLLLTVSEFSKSRLISLMDVPEKKVFVVGNGVEDDLFREDFAVKNSFVPDSSLPYVIVVGGLTLRKGGDRVLEVSDLLVRCGAALKILVVGKNENEFEDLARSKPNIVLLGYLDRESLIAVLRKAIALLFLSRYEGFGIPVIEAMAVGTPVVISDQPALKEIAGNSAIVVGGNKLEDAADALIALTDDNEMHAELSKKGKERAIAYSWERCVDRLLAAFKHN